MAGERTRYNVGVRKLPYEQRDVAHRVLTAADPRGFVDVMGAATPDDHDTFPVGAHVAYSVELTDDEAEQFRAASNVRYVEPDGVLQSAGVSSTATLAYLEATFPGADTWHGRDVPMALIDSGTTAAVRAAIGATLLGRQAFGTGTDPAPAEVWPDGSNHGCRQASIAVPTGGQFYDFLATNSSGFAVFSALAAAMIAAADLGVKIVVSAFGAVDESQVAHDATDYLRDRDVQLFTPAGNNSSTSIWYPAAYSATYANVHSVINFDQSTDTRYPTSNHAATATGCAPGTNVASLDATATTSAWTGTSAATSHAALVCARAATGGLRTPAQVAAAMRANLRNTGQPASEQGGGAFSLRRTVASFSKQLKLDYAQANVVAAGCVDDSFQRQNGAGTFNDPTVAWPAVITAAPAGMGGGRAAPFAIPNNYRRYEMVPDIEFGPGETHYFGDAFYLEAGFPTNATNYQVISQLHQGDSGGSPVVAIEVLNGNLMLTGGYAADPDNPTRLAYQRTLLTGVATGHRYNVVYRVSNFSTAEFSSTIDVWVDGVQRLAGYVIPPGTLRGGATYWKLGLYHDEANAGGTVWHAGTAVGDTYAYADPSITSPTTQATGGMSGVGTLSGFGIPISSLVDDFTAARPAEWTDNGATLTGGGAQVIVASTAGVPIFASRRSRGTYLFDSATFYDVAMPGVAGDTANAQLWVQDAAPADTVDRAGFEYLAATHQLEFLVQSGATYAAVGTTVTVAYDPIAHRNLRIVRTTTALTWWTSPDGLTWTLQRTLTGPAAWTGKGTCQVSLEGFRSTGVNDVLRVGAVNVDKAPLPTTPSAPADALQNRTLYELREWSRWLTNVGARGWVGEYGWVTLWTRYDDAPQGAKWAALGEIYLRELDVLGIGSTPWASGRHWGAGYPLGIDVGNVEGDPLTYRNIDAAPIGNHPTRGTGNATRWRGVGLAGYERGISTAGGSGVRANTALTHTDADFALLASQGVDLVRLAVPWERVQLTLGAALDTAALTVIDGMLTAARKHGIRVVFDLHNYGRYTQANGTVVALGGALSNAQFADFWTRFATWLQANATRSGTVIGLGLMNEPHDLAGGAAGWKTASQAALNAIRATGDTRLVLVGGYSWSSLTDWVAVHGATGWITDSAGNYTYEAHHYWDTQTDPSLGSRSGTFQQPAPGGGTSILTYARELASAGAFTPSLGGTFAAVGSLGPPTWRTTITTGGPALTGVASIGATAVRTTRPAGGMSGAGGLGVAGSGSSATLPPAAMTGVSAWNVAAVNFAGPQTIWTGRGSFGEIVTQVTVAASVPAMTGVGLLGAGNPASGFGTAPFGTAPFGSGTAGNLPGLPIGEGPFGTTPLGGAPNTAIPIGQGPFGITPLGGGAQGTAHLTVAIAGAMSGAGSLTGGSVLNGAPFLSGVGTASGTAFSFATGAVMFGGGSFGEIVAGPPAKTGDAALAGVGDLSGHIDLSIVVLRPGMVGVGGFGGAQQTIDAIAFTPIFVVPAGPVRPQVSVPRTTLLVVETVTGRVLWRMPYTDLTWSAPLNKIGSVGATLAVDDTLDGMSDQKVLDPRSTLRAFLTGPYRFSLVPCYGSAPLAGGPLLPSDDIAGDRVKVSAVGMERMFEKRVLNLPTGTGTLADPSRDITYANTTLRRALYLLFQEGMTPYLGRTSRLLPVTCTDPPPDERGWDTFTWTAYDVVKVWKAATDLMAAVGGPDVRLEPFLTDTDNGPHVYWDLQIGTPYLPASGQPGPQGPLPWTFTPTNDTITRTVDAVGMATSYFATGDGQDRDKLIARADSSKLTSLGFPDLEEVSSGGAGGSRGTDPFYVQDDADSWLTAHQTPTSTIKLEVPVDGSPDIGMVRRGDLARIDLRGKLYADSGYEYRRITQIDGGSKRTATLTCDLDDEGA